MIRNMVHFDGEVLPAPRPTAKLEAYPLSAVHDCLFNIIASIGQFKCDGTRTGTRFRLSTKRASPFKSAGGRQFSGLLAAEVCASAVVMLDTPCSEVV